METSVIITTYQRPKLVKRAINSVVNQIYLPKEIIVIEDGSDSGISKWIKKNHPEIIYKKNEQNLGLAGSRNAGIQLAKYDWIAFLDDDDEWMPERLERQVETLNQISKEEQENIACVQVGTKQIHTNSNRITYNLPKNHGKLFESITKVGLSTPSSSFLFNAVILKDIGGFDEDIVSGIDHDIWMKVATNGYHTIGIKEPLVKVYVDANENMMSDTYKRIKGISQFLGKWESSFYIMFGEKETVRFKKIYFIKVIGRLSGEKLYFGKYSEAKKCMTAIFKMESLNINDIVFMLIFVSKIYLLKKFPLIYKLIKASGSTS